MGNLTGKQILGIIAAVLSALVASTAQLTDIFGPTTAKAVISAASIGSTILNSILVGISGQSSLVKDVAAMPGVDSIKVNSDANSTLAALAMDPLQDKVAPKPSDADDVLATAKGEG